MATKRRPEARPMEWWLAALLMWGALASAADWPTWCGSAGRNPVSPETGLPALFRPGVRDTKTGAMDLSTALNVKWVARLGSLTYGSPVVAGGRVYIGTNNGTRLASADPRTPPRDAKYTGDRNVMLCFDEATGELRWQLCLPKWRKVGRDQPDMGNCATPTVDGAYVYMVSNRGEVLCLDVNGLADGNDGPYRDEAWCYGGGLAAVELGATDADIIWRYDMVAKLGVVPHDACASATLVLGDLLYVATGNGMDDQDWKTSRKGANATAPSPRAPAVIALDRRTGALVARDDAGIGHRLVHGAWSSPTLGVVAGQPHLYYGGGDGYLYCLNPTPSAPDAKGIRWLRKQWSFDGNPPEKRARPVTWMDRDGRLQIIATPVVQDGRVYFAMGEDPYHRTGSWGRLWCVDAATGRAVWHYDALNRCDTTAAVADGMVFVADLAGRVHCLDATTGAPCWTYDLRGKSPVMASPMVADGRVYVTAQNGDMSVFPLSRTAHPPVTIPLGHGTDSTPCVANGALYFATATYLTAVAATAAPAPRPTPR